MISYSRGLGIAFIIHSYLYIGGNVSNIMIKISASEIWKRHAVLHGFYIGSVKIKISVCGQQSEDRFISIQLKTKQPVRMMVLVVVTSDGDFQPLFIFPTLFQTQLEGLYQVPGGGIAELVQEGGFKKILRLTIVPCTQLHEQKNPVLAVRIFLRPIDKMRDAITKDELKAKITTAFSYLNDSTQIVFISHRYICSHGEDPSK